MAHIAISSDGGDTFSPVTYDFIFARPARISSLSPARGDWSGGTRITIHGSHFSAAGTPVAIKHLG